MRRTASVLALFGVLACAALPVAASAQRTPDDPARAETAVGSWAEKEIRAVVDRGWMGPNVRAFRPEDTLTGTELAELVAGITGAPPTSGAPGAVTVATLDSELVKALGLGRAAATFARAARAGGLALPTRFGTEAVARLLGLRLNHPDGQDALELEPTDPTTRAEAAYSAARILALTDGDRREVAQLATEFALPALDEWQARILRTAVHLIGYPYVWGGTSDETQEPFGLEVPGGFDCSGFVWRVYKLEAYDDEDALADTLRGRTTYAMSGEVPAAQRIAFARLQPADVLFFGARGPKSSPSEVNHMGIYVGGGWFIHSSSYGVAVARLGGWYRDRFAWGRRPLAEAGLS